MFQMYKNYYTNNNPVSRLIYEREFYKLILSFKKPYIDTVIIRYIKNGDYNR